MTERMSAAHMRQVGTADAAFERELVQEKASALGRLGRQLEVALAALAAFEAAHSQIPLSPAGRCRRDGLINEAASCVWNLAVQREACGLRDDGGMMNDFGVPAEVRQRAGLVVVSLHRRLRA